MKPLELEFKEFTQIGEFAGYRILARGEERLLYDIARREVFLRYTSKDDICKYIKEKNEPEKKNTM
jgi:hypothetical protein